MWWTQSKPAVFAVSSQRSVTVGVHVLRRRPRAYRCSYAGCDSVVVGQTMPTTERRHRADGRQCVHCTSIVGFEDVILLLKLYIFYIILVLSVYCYRYHDRKYTVFLEMLKHQQTYKDIMAQNYSG